MRRIRTLLAIAAVAVSLAGCAGSISAPTAVQSLSMEQKSTLYLSDIVADAAQGIEMGVTDFDRIRERVRAAIGTQTPAALVNSNDKSMYKMQIHFTRYDRGSALARGILIGLGQIHIDATVYLLDTAGQPVAQYAVSKTFALGGIAGATTTVEDVEDGFAKSVAEIVKV